MARKSAVPTEDIPAITQLSTPHGIVRYLVENSLGCLWRLNSPGFLPCIEWGAMRLTDGSSSHS